MHIKDIETRTGLSRANIRYYEQEGLVHPVRARNGYRDYSQEDLDTLYAALQEHHPDLYANTPQEAFEAKKAEIEGRLAAGRAH